MLQVESVSRCVLLCYACVNVLVLRVVKMHDLFSITVHRTGPVVAVHLYVQHRPKFEFEFCRDLASTRLPSALVIAIWNDKTAASTRLSLGGKRPSRSGMALIIFAQISR